MSDIRSLFISDLHLDSDGAATSRGFGRLLENRLGGCDELYILGDLVEVWIGDDDDSPLAEMLGRQLREASRNCDVYLMHGNRDFLLGENFAAATGATLLADPVTIERRGKRIVLSHGDMFCTRDVAYQQMRSLFRSTQWQADVLARSLEARRDMARGLRAQSAAASANKHDNIMDVTESDVIACLTAHDAHVIIHGHTHRPGIHQHQLRDRVATRYVLGDWDRCGWALRADSAGFEMLRFALQ